MRRRALRPDKSKIKTQNGSTMKKVSLMLGALALVLGISQCKKQESPVQAGEKQYIEVTANNGNDGSKVNVDFASVPTVMNLTWEKGDVITVSGGAEGTLTLDDGAETAQGHFSGEITMGAGELTFTYKKCESTLDFGAQDGTSAWIKNNLYLEAKTNYNDNGKYSLLMEMPYVVLKLDLSAFVGTQNDVTIKAGDVPVVTFESLEKADAEEMFVALPANGTEQTYTFSGNDKTGKKTWTLEASTYYTAEGGNAVVIKPFLFSVAEGVTVEFAPGNLWYGIAAGESTPAFHFEENQWDYSVGEWDDWNYWYNWDPSHVSHFYWSKDAAEATKSEFNYEQSMSIEDVFFTNSTETAANPDFHVNGETGENQWRTLSRAEWDYLLGYDPEEQTDSYGRLGAKGLCEWKELDDGAHKGLVILPDGTENPSTVMSSISSTSDLASSGAVFLPAAGGRFVTYVDRVGSYGFYRSSTPCGVDEGNAYIVDFNSRRLFTDSDARGFGYAVRLVR